MPREICSFGLKSPKLSEKPLITKWCFDPNEESSVPRQDDPEKSEDVEDSEDVEEFNDVEDSEDLPSWPEFNDVVNNQDELGKDLIFRSDSISSLGV